MDNGLSRNTIDRRRFLRLCGLSVAAGLLPASAWAARKPSARVISLHNIHTGESLRSPYFEDGAYVPEALAEIGRLLRDHRSGEVAEIDPALIDRLHAVSVALGTDVPFHVISGYRSPATNAALRKAGRGVARRSYHLLGRAVDVRLPGVSHADLLRTALAQNVGGVGDYPRSDFVHLDTGPLRRW